MDRITRRAAIVGTFAAAAAAHPAISAAAIGSEAPKAFSQFVIAYDIGPPVRIEPNPEDDLYGPAAIAAFLGISEARTIDLLNRGMIPARKVDGQLTARRSRLSFRGEVEATPQAQPA